MNKELLLRALIEELSANLQSALAAAQATYDEATHEDNKAENKYDTRSLEASYLAGAQAKRFKDLKETLSLVSSLKMRSFSDSDKIAIGAVVVLESEDAESWLLLLAKGGGQNFSFEGKKIKVITPESPMGANLVGKTCDDSFTLNGKEFVVSGIF